MKSGPVGGAPLVTYSYGSTSTTKNLLNTARVNSVNRVNYTYDEYGRIISKRCFIPNDGNRTFSYTYNTDGLMATKTYPDGTVTAFQYDAYGNHIATTIGDTIVWQLTNATGNTIRYQLANTFQIEDEINSFGLLTSRTLKRNNAPLHSMTFTYNPVTGNLTQRTGMLNTAEAFTYDAKERLTQAGNLAMTYSPDGNILSKTDIGRYYYEDAKPHAVTSIDNTCFLISDSLQTTDYNSCGKVTNISQSGDLEVSITYGPEGERLKSVCRDNGQNYRRIYLDDYEEKIYSQGTTSICYLDGGILAMRDANGVLALRVSFTDNLGSVTRLYDSSANELFNASYDAWGNQTLYRNDIEFHRGYCGHEMLPDYGLINMNGRLYDPQIGRFLSTDNFVQEPWNSQNFNRYSYCLNNPLKYTDPSGEFFWVPIIVGALIGGAVNLGIKACNGQINSFGDGLAAFGIGAIAGAAGGLTGGAAFGLAGGAAGGAGGVFAGMAGGAASAAVSMPIQSLGNHIYFGDPMITGRELLYSVAFSAALGGAINGTVAKMNGRSFWSGKPSIQMSISPIEPVSIGSAESNVTQFDAEIPNSQMKISPYEKGQLGVNRAIAEFEESGGTLLQKEVTIEVDGVRNRFDFVGVKNGELHFFEVKNGPYARMTPHQKINIPKLQQGASFIPVGRNAAEINYLRSFVLTRSPYNKKIVINYIHYE